IGMRREEARQSRHQPLRGKAGSAMKSQDGGPTRGYRLNAIPQIFESPTDIAVEEFPFRRQVNFSCASHKQLYPMPASSFRMAWLTALGDSASSSEACLKEPVRPAASNVRNSESGTLPNIESSLSVN